MSTDAGSAAAPEDAATREESSERPGLESGDPQSADSATSTPETADRGVGGSARSSAEADEESDEGSPDAEAGSDAADADDSTDAEPTVTERTDTADEAAVDDSSGDGADGGDRDPSPANEGFMTTILRDATITGLPGETGMPPVEPHSPEAQQEGDEPVGSEPRTGDNPDGVD
jgi:hypothetical protein